MSEAVQRALEFVEKINAHDVGAICAMLTEDSTFIDSQGATVSGRENLRKAWTSYFGAFPDYEITVKEIFSDGDRVVLLGYAAGSRLGNGFRIPSAWKAVILGGEIWEWRVYADNEVPRRLFTPPE